MGNRPPHLVPAPETGDHCLALDGVRRVNVDQANLQGMAKGGPFLEHPDHRLDVGAVSQVVVEPDLPPRPLLEEREALPRGTCIDRWEGECPEVVDDEDVGPAHGTTMHARELASRRVAPLRHRARAAMARSAVRATR